MSKKFEQLLDLVVNEEMDKANELFHDLVVEMSREIYENMITQEGEEEEEDDMEESMYGDDDMEEETTMEIGGDQSDDFVSDVEDEMDSDGIDSDEMDSDEMGSDEMDSDEMGSDEMGDEEGAEDRISDLEDALEELKAEFEALMAGEKAEPEHADMFGDEDGEEAGEEKKEAFHMESRRMTREYHEKVGDGHGADKKGKGEEGGINTKSTVSSAKGRPSSDASANNIAQGGSGADAKPGVGGVLKKGGEFVKSGTQNVGNTKAKGYSDKVAGGGAEKKHAGETNVNSKPVVGG